MEKIDEKQIWESYIPAIVDLCYVNYDENLEDSEYAIEDCIVKNCIDPIWDEIDDLVIERTENSIREYIDDMQRRMENDGLEWFDSWEENIRDSLTSLDVSTPAKDFLRNTRKIPVFYDLGQVYGGLWDASDERVEEVVNKVCSTLNIPSDDEVRVEQIRSVVLGSADHGHLRIYFKSDLENLLCMVEDSDFKSVRFKGNFTVALHDPECGGGWSEEMILDCVFKFNRNNLHHSEAADRYGYYALYGCEADGDEPKFSLYDSKNAAEIEESNIEAVKAKEREYEATFRKGGCTFGDTRMSRHPKVQYRNSIPCGWKCPVCGQFWID